jgi:hypothetical protein
MLPFSLSDSRIPVYFPWMRDLLYLGLCIFRYLAAYPHSPHLLDFLKMTTKLVSRERLPTKIYIDNEVRNGKDFKAMSTV